MAFFADYPRQEHSVLAFFLWYGPSMDHDIGTEWVERCRPGELRRVVETIGTATSIYQHDLREATRHESASDKPDPVFDCPRGESRMKREAVGFVSVELHIVRAPKTVEVIGDAADDSPLPGLSHRDP